MNSNKNSVALWIGLIMGLGMSIAAADALAQNLPGPADVGRIKPDDNTKVPEHLDGKNASIPLTPTNVSIPEGSKSVHFTLSQVSIEGVTAFTKEQMEDIYKQYLNREITLDIAYVMAGMITERYRNAGYFLSRAYVPAQEIEGGKITIKVVEGYVSNVELPEGECYPLVIKYHINKLIAKRPLQSKDMESFLLRLNDMPGYAYSGVLSPVEGEDGVVKLVLVSDKKKVGSGYISFDNFSSRYLGPNELSGSYTKSFLPLQQTSISALSSLPAKNLHYGTLNHTAMIAPDTTLELSGGITKANPGYTLQSYNIESTSTSASVAINYQIIRQRQENLSMKFMLDSRDVSSDILKKALTRDHIRMVRVGATYDRDDIWNGHDVLNATLSKGINAFGSSQRGDLNLSRQDASPDFTKTELSLSRIQGISKYWSVAANASWQWASGTLYSSEQFGYGGQSFGRAYDSSDITGDNGIAGSLELRYSGLNDLMCGEWKSLSLQPYAFYDIGSVWSEESNLIKRESAASAGFGMRFNTRWNQNGNIGLAWPLTRNIPSPVYGGRDIGPRIILKVGQEF